MCTLLLHGHLAVTLLDARLTGHPQKRICWNAQLLGSSNTNRHDPDWHKPRYRCSR
jgi:hypothetical protein